jgi:hypothetical protein
VRIGRCARSPTIPHRLPSWPPSGAFACTTIPAASH